MSAKAPNIDERPYDARLKQIAKILDRVTTGALCVAVPVCSARLPHYQIFGLVVLVFTGVDIAFLLAIKIGQRLNLVGAKLVVDKSSILEDEIAAPVLKNVPIQRDVTQDKALGGLHADEIAKTHHVDVAGVGRVTYWLADRRG